MPLPPGTRLGPYEITGAIGAGGMGEVYRARELREREPALTWLGQAEVERSSAVLYLKVDRAFDWLHDDPRFTALLKRLNLDSTRAARR